MGKEGTISVPIGTVGFYSGDLTQAAQVQALKNAGWLLCDGTSYQANTYPDLYAAIGAANGGGSGTFNVPDLRDRFIRGVDASGSSVDPDAGARTAAQQGGATGRDVGSLQAGATALPQTSVTVNNSAAHTHTYSHLNSNQHLAWSGSTYTMARWASPSTTDAAGAHFHTLSGFDAATAPISIALFAIIKAAEVQDDGGATPAGAIIPFAGPSHTAPGGWLYCDGMAYGESRYPALNGVILNSFGGDGESVFNVPDLRGYFVRGTSHATGRDPDAASRYPLNTGGNVGDAPGSAQKPATFLSPSTVTVPTAGAHAHNRTLVPQDDHHAAWGAVGPAAFNTMEWTTAATTTSSDGIHTHTLVGGDDETRPPNVYMDWLIASDDVGASAPPVGTVMAFGGDITSFQTEMQLYDLGWYPCDGSGLLKSAPENQALYAVIGETYGGSSLKFNVPDLRGYFVVGASPARAVGSRQPKSTTGKPVTPIITTTDGDHSHAIDNIPTETHVIDVVAGDDFAENNSNASPSSTDPGHTHTLADGGDKESRPINVNVDYIIRYK